MVLHIDPRQEQAAILSIPRDVVVPIAGTDVVDRVNAAFSLGGAEGLIATVQQSLGITINHYVEVDFVGFKDIVDAVGGVEIYLPRWARDFTSGLDLPKIGCVSVNGTQGLAFVRSRHYEELVDGKWVTDPSGDFGRINRQQDFIRRMLKKALSAGITNPDPAEPAHRHRDQRRQDRPDAVHQGHRPARPPVRRPRPGHGPPVHAARCPRLHRREVGHAPPWSRRPSPSSSS